MAVSPAARKTAKYMNLMLWKSLKKAIK